MFSVQLLWDHGGVKRGRRVLLIVAACGVLAVFAALLWPSGEREPVYQGKTLSWWITRHSGTTSRDDERVHAAIRKMGTNALPFLVMWIDCGAVPKPSNFDTALRKMNGRMWGAWMRVKWRKISRAYDAVWAFRILGDEGRPAVPALLQLTHSTNSIVAQIALWTLDGIEGRQKDPLLRVLDGSYAHTNGFRIRDISADNLGKPGSSWEADQKTNSKAANPSP